MPEKQLREDLDKLRLEIVNLDSDEQAKEKLNSLVAEIEQELEESGLTDKAKNLSEQVEDSISRFEATHPTLTGILNNIMVTLSGIGV